MNVPEKVVRHPDPCIYAQSALMANPAQIRWENVDIALFDETTGLPMRSTFDVDAGGQYRIEVTVHNCSADVAAHNTRVELFAARFGIGGWFLGLTPIPVATPFVHVPPGSIAIVSATWVSPTNQAAFLARLSHPDDASTSNNEGWHVTRLNEVDPTSGGSPIFPIWNPFTGMRFIRVRIIEEGPESWFPDDEILIGRPDQFLPVGLLPESDSHITSGHLANLFFDVPDATPPGTLHISHLTATAVADLTGPETLVGGVTHIVRTV